MASLPPAVSRWLVVLIPAAVLSTVAWWWLAPSGSDRPAPGAGMERPLLAVPVAPTLVGLGNAEAARLQAAPGRELRYRFATASRTRATVQGIRSGERGRAFPLDLQTTTRLSGDLAIRVLADDAGGRIVEARVSGLALEVRQVPEPPGPEDAPPGASVPFSVIADVAPDGRIRRIVSAEDAAQRWVHLAHAALGLWEVVVPQAPVPERWQAQGSDPLGTFAAEYRRVSGPEESPARFERRKLRYESISGTSRARDTEVAIADDASIRYTGIAVSVQGRFRTDLTAKPADLVLLSEGTYQLEMVSAHELPDVGSALATAKLRLATPAGADAPPDPSLAVAPSMRGLARVLGPEALRSAVAAIVEGIEGRPWTPEGDANPHIDAMGALTTFLSANPAAAPLILDHLRARASSEAIHPDFVASLGACGSPEAQAGLTEILTSPGWSASTRTQAVVASLQVDRPETALEDALRRLAAEAGPDATNARLVLAACGNKVRGTDPARARRIEQEILSLHRKDMPLEETAAWMTMLQNCGVDVVPDGVHDGLDAADPVLRSLAVQALQRVRDPEADEILTDLCATDDSDEVRATALTTLVERHLFGPGQRKSLQAPLDEIVASVGNSARTPRLRRVALSLLTRLQ